MLKGRGRDPRGAVPPTPATMHHNMRPPAITPPGRPSQTPLMNRAAYVKPEPDYEVVEFPSEQYVNAKLQPPPPPPPRPPTGHPVEAGASCGLCGGGGARVRCAECGRRALCASCDDMYHRHPKRRNHQRQAISLTQMRDELPPLPPKASPPVPPPRRHKISGDRMSASPRPSSTEQHRAPFDHIHHISHSQSPLSQISNHTQHTRPQIPLHLQTKLSTTPTLNHIGSMPYIPTTMHHTPTTVHQNHGHHTLGHINPAWNRPRGSLQSFNFQQPPVTESWDPEGLTLSGQGWSRPLRRGASVLELGGGTTTCAGCAQCTPAGWRYGSCANLEHPWQNVWQPTCCVGPQPTPQVAHHDAHLHTHPHHLPHTPQPHRRAYVESRKVSRAASRAGSRPASPATSVRSRTLRRNKHRTPSPPPLPSSDADSESDGESNSPPANSNADNEDSLGPAPPPSELSWQCEHCTFVNEPGIRVCAVCCRTPTVAPQIIVSDIQEDVEKMKINTTTDRSYTKESLTKQNGVKNNTKPKRDRVSTGCNPSPPKEQESSKKPLNRVMTPSSEKSETERIGHHQERHDMAVGPSPPREIKNARESKQSTASGPSPPRESIKNVRVSPYRDIKESTESSKVHSISVGLSPPRDMPNIVHTSVEVSPRNPVLTVQKKSTGTSPPRDTTENKKYASTSTKTNVSNTGTSPPPQSISTQTYEAPSTWERAPSASRSRPRRRFRDEARRERSHSRHSVSSDTRDSDLSVRTVGTNGRWEWRDRSPGEEWSESSRLSRRASHLDLRRNAQPHRRSGFYGSEAASPEPNSAIRAGSVEALAGPTTRREAERGLELARLMAEAERLGFSAVEVKAALAQSPAAPLAWLRSRWPSLCAGVRAAAARLAPDASISELEARAALARHRGAMWPAVTDCIERYRRQTGVVDISEEGRLRGRVWGSPAGAEDDAAPKGSSRRSSRVRAEDSSDEYEAPLREKYRDDDWMYLPLDVNVNYTHETDPNPNLWSGFPYDVPPNNSRDLTLTSKKENKTLIDGDLLQNLLSDNILFNLEESADVISDKYSPFDLVQSENDFIDAYNALAKTNPLPNINNLEYSSITRKKDTLKRKKDAQNGFNNNEQIRSIDQNRIKETQSGGVVNTPLKISTDLENVSKREIKIKSQRRPNHNDKQGETSNIVTDMKLASDVIDTTANRNLKKEQNSIENNYEDKSEEKTKKLNDIVDNTQKLIQQMKEEINLDINSLDEHNISNSERESSSNDEQESSYSDTESGTDNITSDESETSNTDNEELSKSKINPILVQRTSSEDNEQFEEALENLENQIDDFKHSNIELLDTIARSLQEDHTLEIKEPEKQDSNNNLYTVVNSFEEIYEELNSSSPVSENIKKQTVLVTNRETTSDVLPHIYLIPRQNISFSSFKTIAPRKVIISQNKQPTFNAKIGIIEDNPVNIVNDEIQEITEKDTQTTNEELLSSEQTIVKEHSILNILDDRDAVSTENSVEMPVLIDTIIQDESIEIVTNSQKDDPTNQNNINNNTINNKLNGSFNSDKNNEGVEKMNLENETITTIENNNKTVTTKSNIPKLIKNTHTNKGKVEKNTPKLIVSKVPIRRTSIKQYPAPAPPKSHFGNIHLGNVKHLQTRLLNAKTKDNANSLEIIEPKPSTSTLSKKKPAPPPPIIPSQETRQATLTNPSPPKEKKNYFRETCRTEDEWTESDSEEPQVQSKKPTPEHQERPSSPPPPITLRRVSGQLIDLAKVRLPEGSPERQARMLLAEGATETWEQAQLAVELVTRGTDPSAALMAALECIDLPSALAYLHQECELCASRFPEHEMVSMLRCTHRCCRECAHHYFTVQITERSISDCVCPYCKAPDLENLPEDAWLDYFAHLDILLKTLLENEIHELFQRKLRDRTLARDPNFKWCMECSSGFFVHPKQKKLRCPECRSISCASCRKPWTANHEGLTCEQYVAWIEDNDPERSVSAIQQHLRDNGLECPRCHFKYSLSRGGCMHFTCTQCKYEFCYGCGKPFTMGIRCGLSEYCAKLGLHAHHPRNCLFYLRDKEPHELQTLLQMNNVQYETNPTEGSNGRCPIQLQRETPTGLIDGTCGSEAPSNYAGLCKNHYLEYLSRLVRRNEIDPLPILGVDDLETLVRRAALRLPPRPAHYVEYLAGLARKLDPIPIMDVAELIAELRRRALPLPERGPWDTDPIYAGMCAEIVRDKIPLD